ncbi:MAG: short-chain fatty acyl-CoA regulator family protein [Paracoccaceae bacterium]
MGKSLIGTRIREHRTRIGISQTALAARAGISTSYLNLIEHNKRGIAGKILLAISRELNVSATSLSEGADSALIGAIQEAAAYIPAQTPETEVLAEFVGRYPGWSQLLASLYRQVRDQEGTISALSDRLTHDPFLAESLHQMLSNITAIRSTASILTSTSGIPDAQKSRFHAAIHDESKRLSDVAQALTAYFDQAIDKTARAATPEEELDQFMNGHAYHFPTLDMPYADESDIDRLLDQAVDVQTPQARIMAKGRLLTYLNDAKDLPLDAFIPAAETAKYNPAVLADSFNVSLHAVFCRLASLNHSGHDIPEMGLIIVNAAGHALIRRPLPTFALPRYGNTCPLWPIYQGFTLPDQPLHTYVELPNTTRFITLTFATSGTTPRFDMPPVYTSAMLIIPQDQANVLASWLPKDRKSHKIGISCRICTRKNCAARSETRIR